MSETSESLAFLRECPAIDLHADTLMWGRWLGYDVLKRHEAPLPMAALGGHVDVPRMKDGGLGAQFFSLVSLPFVGQGGMGKIVHEQIDVLEQWIAASKGALSLALSAEDLERAEKEKRVVGLLGIEGAHALGGKLAPLDAFAKRGVRYLGLLHFSANEVGSPAYGKGANTNGLTSFGHSVVERCNDLGVIVDLSHINRAGFLEACQRTQSPVIVSHTGILGAFDHWRNIDDEQLRAVANKGGCIGVIFVPRYLGADGLEPVVNHLKHIIDVVGEDVPALGSDWDGFVVPTKELADPRGLPHLATALLEHGFEERVVRKIFRENALRVLRDVPFRAAP